MKEKIDHIKNPLSIIAVFSGISEISASAVLPFISEKLQGIFIWFLIFFPIFLILLFFITLWTKHFVLYAPSDYSSDDSFLKVIPQTGQEIKNKFFEDTFMQNKENDKPNIDSNNLTNSIDYTNPGFDVTNRDNYVLAEQLCLNKLKEKLGSNFKTQCTITAGRISIKLDGLLKDRDHWYFYEIKYFPAINTSIDGIEKNIQTFKSFVRAANMNLKITYHIHIATPVDDDSKEKIKQRFMNDYTVDDDIFFEIEDYLKLRKEYNLD
ncbi:hypothetical protein FACS189491_02610 [Spirochaetia bacterium]|nr:hypothetical protein FACS189491_02610 [Spirochaetia bacterium]